MAVRLCTVPVEPIAVCSRWGVWMWRRAEPGSGFPRSFRQARQTKTLVVGFGNARSFVWILHLDFDVPATPRNGQRRIEDESSIDGLTGLIETPEKRESGYPVSQSHDVGRILPQVFGSPVEHSLLIAIDEIC